MTQNRRGAKTYARKNKQKNRQPSHVSLAAAEPYVDMRRVEELFERARKNAAGTPPRKHHLVPASYLQRWAESGSVRMTDVNEARSFKSSPEKAARETDYYSLSSEDIDPEEVPPLLLETILSQIEGDGKQVIDRLLETGDQNALTMDQRVSFALYLAFQLTRGQFFRSRSQKMANDAFKLMYENTTEEGVRWLLRKNGRPTDEKTVSASLEFVDGLRTGEYFVEQQRATVAGQCAGAAVEIGERFVQYDWVIHRTPPVLVTCDEPVLLIGGPNRSRTERCGIENAGIIVFPLAPDALLSLMHPGTARRFFPAELDHVETAEINLELMANAHRWAFERSTRQTTMRLKVPPPAEPTAIQRFRPTNDGGGTRMLVRSYLPNRWSNADMVPSWPVARWWN